MRHEASELRYSCAKKSSGTCTIGALRAASPKAIMGETCACKQRAEPAFPFAVRLLCGRQGTLQQAVASNLLPNSHCHARFAGAENRDQIGVQLGMLGGTASMDARFCLSNFF